MKPRIRRGLGEIDSGFEWLEKTFEERGKQLYWINAHPRFDSIRSDPRFTDILRRMNFPPAKIAIQRRNANPRVMIQGLCGRKKMTIIVRLVLASSVHLFPEELIFELIDRNYSCDEQES